MVDSLIVILNWQLLFGVTNWGIMRAAETTTTVGSDYTATWCRCAATSNTATAHTTAAFAARSAFPLLHLDLDAVADRVGYEPEDFAPGSFGLRVELDLVRDALL